LLTGPINCASINAVGAISNGIYTLFTGSIISSGPFNNGSNTLWTGNITSSGIVNSSKVYTTDISSNTINSNSITCNTITANNDVIINTGSASYLKLQVGGSNVLQLAVNASNSYFISPDFHFYDASFTIELIRLNTSLLEVNLPITSSGSISCSKIKTSGYINAQGIPPVYMLDVGGGFYTVIATLYDFGRLNMSYRDDFWYVCGGYKLELFTGSNFTGSSQIIDNTSGTTILTQAMATPNANNSCKLYYNGTQVNLFGLSY
jgi:hypothetical protein